MKTKLYALISLFLLGGAVDASAQCSITSGPTVNVNGATINVTATGTGATTPIYVWSWGDASNPGTMQSDSHTYTASGTYTVCVVYADQSNPFTCNDSACTIVNIVVSGINNVNNVPITLATAPNPFSSSINISYSMPQAGNVDIKVYDILGKEVATIVKNESQASGKHDLKWDNSLDNGIYFIHMKVGDKTIVRKVVRQ